MTTGRPKFGDFDVAGLVEETLEYLDSDAGFRTRSCLANDLACVDVNRVKGDLLALVQDHPDVWIPLALRCAAHPALHRIALSLVHRISPSASSAVLLTLISRFVFAPR